MIFATYQGFDLNKDQDMIKRTFLMVIPRLRLISMTYYKNRSDVKCYMKDGECDSDSSDSDFAEDD